MGVRKYSDRDIELAREVLKEVGGRNVEARKVLKERHGIEFSLSSISNIKRFGTTILSGVKKRDKTQVQEAQEERKGREVVKDFSGNTGMVTTRSADIRTLEDALAAAEVDLDVWEVVRYVVNSWEVTMGAGASGTGKAETFTNFQVKIWLKRKEPQVQALERLLAELKANGPKVPKLKRWPRKGKPKRALEVAIFDPHLGLHCFEAGSDKSWSLEECEQMVLEVVERLLGLAQSYEPFERVVFPFGNDWFHSDNVFGTTTEGTRQPEADAWQHVYERGQALAIAVVDRLRRVAPVQVVVVPGNHARQTEFTLGRLLQAYYHNDKNVEVDASASPYKFFKWGVNLIGFDHGHSIRPIRLAALMANECRDVWNETVYREWHIGDQHRKGAAKPVMMEEQGVSIEYLPGLTPANEWHRIKSYNWQKRGAMAFVWDKEAGPVARLQVNIDSYTGRVMGG